jgi:hypothetical protein
VKDLKIWRALLRPKRDKIPIAFNNLKRLGYVTATGALTPRGTAFVRRAIEE